MPELKAEKLLNALGAPPIIQGSRYELTPVSYTGDSQITLTANTKTVISVPKEDVYGLSKSFISWITTHAGVNTFSHKHYTDAPPWNYLIFKTPGKSNNRLVDINEFADYWRECILPRADEDRLKRNGYWKSSTAAGTAYGYNKFLNITANTSSTAITAHSPHTHVATVAGVLEAANTNRNVGAQIALGVSGALDAGGSEGDLEYYNKVCFGDLIDHFISHDKDFGLHEDLEIEIGWKKGSEWGFDTDDLDDYDTTSEFTVSPTISDLTLTLAIQRNESKVAEYWAMYNRGFAIATNNIQLTSKSVPNTTTTPAIDVEFGTAYGDLLQRIVVVIRHLNESKALVRNPNNASSLLVESITSIKVGNDDILSGTQLFGFNDTLQHLMDHNVVGDIFWDQAKYEHILGAYYAIDFGKGSASSTQLSGVDLSSKGISNNKMLIKLARPNTTYALASNAWVYYNAEIRVGRMIVHGYAPLNTDVGL